MTNQDPTLENFHHRLDLLIRELRALQTTQDQGQATLTRVWELTNDFAANLDRHLTNMENKIYDAFFIEKMKLKDGM